MQGHSARLALVLIVKSTVVGGHPVSSHCRGVFLCDDQRMRRTNAVSLDDVPAVLRGELSEAVERAVAAGADEEALEYVGAGGEGIVFVADGIAYKVGRRDRGLRHEAAALEALDELGAPVPWFHRYDADADVIVREHIEGRPGRWADGKQLRDLWEQKIIPALKRADFTAGEFKEDSFVFTEGGMPVMVDLGQVHPIGERALIEVRRQMANLSPDMSAYDLQSEIRFALSDNLITVDQAEVWADDLADVFGDDSQWVTSLREAIRFHRGLRKTNPALRAADRRIAAQSMAEEHEAIAAYGSRLRRARDPKLRAELRHARKEERQHARGFASVLAQNPAGDQEAEITYRGSQYRAEVRAGRPGQVPTVTIYKDGSKLTTGYIHHGMLEWEDYWGNLGPYEPAFELLEAELVRENPPYQGWRKGWMEKPLPKNLYRACYRTKTDALNVFLDANRGVVDDYGGENMVHSRASFDAINNRYDIPPRRQVDTIAKAVWWALPGPGPWCLEDIDVELLNETAPAIYNPRGLYFRLPDHIEEAQLLRKEAEYWQEAYGAVEYPDDEVPF